MLGLVSLVGQPVPRDSSPRDYLHKASWIELYRARQVEGLQPEAHDGHHGIFSHTYRYLLLLDLPLVLELKKKVDCFAIG